MAIKGDVIGGSGSLPNDFGLKRVKETISLDGRKDTNYTATIDTANLPNAQIGVKLEGVKNADKIRINKSDYTPSHRRDKN